MCVVHRPRDGCIMKRRILSFSYLFIFILTLSGSYLMADDHKVSRVIQVFKDEAKNQSQLVINSGSIDGVHENMLYKVLRKKEIYDPYFEKNLDTVDLSAEQTVFIEIARIRTFRVGRQSSMARIEALSQAEDMDLLDYPMIMEGDVVLPVKINIAKINQLTKVFTFFDGDLFEVGSMEIRSEVMDFLKEVGNELDNYSGGKIIIEGHSDRSGDRIQNRQITLQKARVLKTFLVDEIGLDDEDIVCIGYGEDDLLKRNSIKSDQRYNNRLVIKYLQY